MLELYALPEAARILLSIASVVSAGFAALALVLHQYRFKRGPAWWLESAAALLALCQAIINAALLAQVQHNILDGYAVPGGYVLARYAVFVAITAVFICLCAKRKPLLPGAITAASLLSLPCMETWAGRAFPVCFAAALLALLAGSIHLIVKIRRELAASISGLSVKQAMDSLGHGILFFGKNGHILMQNSKMRELMRATAGRVLYNGRLFLETVVAVGGERRGEGSWLYKLPDGEWLFTAKEIKPGWGRPVTRLTAADVTELNRETLLLREIHRELEGRQEQLQALIEGVETACRDENLLHMKTELHDAHNEKLTTLLQYLRYGELPEDGGSFDEIRESVLRSIEEPKTAPASPEDMLDATAGQYGRKGVKICLAGSLPPDREIALAFVKILQEAAANAVKHGYANEVYAEIKDEGGCAVLRVTDNSALPPKEEIREGGGIAGMRSRAEKLGGCLRIDISPRFTLTAHIPNKEAG